MTDYPAPDTQVQVCAGNKELIFRVKMPDNSCKEGVFRITRMRCWRITTVSIMCLWWHFNLRVGEGEGEGGSIDPSGASVCR